VLAESYYTDAGGRREWVNPADVEVTRDAKGKIASARTKDGKEVVFDGVGTMSKSKNNGVDPQELIDHYGADIARFFMMFTSPPEDTLVWSDAGVEGGARFLRRLWTFAYERKSFFQGGIAGKAVDWSTAPEELRKARKEIHANLKQANYDVGRYQFNTVASAAMKILNALERAPAAVKTSAAEKIQSDYRALITEGLSILLRLLSPITPHISHYLWRELKLGEDLLTAPWPEPDPAALIEDEIELVVQVNGRKRGDVRVPRDADSGMIERIVLADPAVQRHVSGQPVKKVVVVPGRLVNVVI